MTTQPKLNFETIEIMLGMPLSLGSDPTSGEYARKAADFYKIVLQSAMMCLNVCVDALTDQDPVQGMVYYNLLSQRFKLVQRAIDAFGSATTRVVKSLTPADPPTPSGGNPIPGDMTNSTPQLEKFLKDNNFNAPADLAEYFNDIGVTLNDISNGANDE